MKVVGASLKGDKSEVHKEGNRKGMRGKKEGKYRYCGHPTALLVQFREGSTEWQSDDDDDDDDGNGEGGERRDKEVSTP